MDQEYDYTIYFSLTMNDSSDGELDQGPLGSLTCYEVRDIFYH